VIVLQPKHDHVELTVSKDRGSIISKTMAMKLDPKTLLILEAWIYSKNFTRRARSERRAQRGKIL